MARFPIPTFPFFPENPQFGTDPSVGTLPGLDRNPVGPSPAPGVPSPTSTTPSGSQPSSTSGGGPTPKKVSVSTIKSRLLRPALTSHYICKFSPSAKNDKLIGFLRRREGEGFTGADYLNPNNQEILELSCTEASLPGVNYLTNEINDDFHGVTERYAYRRSYDDRMDFTFYVDRDYRPINFFESWIAFIAGESNRRAPVDRTYFYRVEFPDNYTTDDLYITKFERDIGTINQGPSLTYRFINAYPININTMPVSYESSQLLKCTVSFTFSRYLIEKTAGGSGTTPPAPGPTTAPGVPGFNEISENLAPNAPTISGPSLPSTTGADVGFGLNTNLAPGAPVINYNRSAGTGAVFNPPPVSPPPVSTESNFNRAISQEQAIQQTGQLPAGGLDRLF